LLRHERVDDGGQPVGSCHVEQVDRADDVVGAVVPEDALLRLGREHRSFERCLARRVDLLVIGEEEQLVPNNGPADVSAVLMLPQPRLRKAACLVDDPLRVQLFVLDRVEDLTVEPVGAALGRELHLHGAFGARFGRQARRGYGDLLDGAKTNRREGEEARAAAAEALRVVVHAVERDVDGAARQAVVLAVACARARGRAGHEQREVQDVAPGERQLRDVLVAHRVGNGRRRRFDDRRPPFHLDLLGEAGDLELHDEIVRAGGLHDDFLDDDRLKPGERGGELIASGLEIGEHESSVGPAFRFGGEAGAEIDQDEIRPGHDRSRRVLDGSDHLPGRARLREDRRRCKEAAGEEGRHECSRAELGFESHHSSDRWPVASS
jgi:hypothetical protein